MGLGVETAMKSLWAESFLRRLKRFFCAALGLGLIGVAPAIWAVPPEKLLRAAGPLPPEASVRAALLKHLQRIDPELDRRKPFKILSGPTLATGNTFGGSIEQAWLMCLVVSAEKREPGPRGIEGKALYLQRSPAGELLVVPIENWKDSSPQC